MHERRGASGWTLARRALFWGLSVVVLLVGIGLAKEERARRTARAAFPPPGRLVSVGTHRLHLHCVGEGRPTVIFESDLDALGSLSWTLVHADVASETRACVYDRAGVMWSDPGPGVSDAERIAEGLRELMRRAGGQAPFLLVGHGVGGAYVRVFAGRYPDLVAGVVLVESAHPDQVARLGTGIGSDSEPPVWMRPIAAAASRLGLSRRMRSPKPGAMPKEVYDAQHAFLPISSLAWFDERRQRARSLQQAGAVTHLGAIPLTVVSVRPRTNQGRPVAGLSAEESRRVRTSWLSLQEELTHLSQESAHVILGEEAGHYPQFGRPREVSKAILETLRRIRADDPPT